MKKSDFEKVLFQHVRLKIGQRWYYGTIEEVTQRRIKFHTGRTIKKPLFREVEEMEIVNVSLVW